MNVTTVSHLLGFCRIPGRNRCTIDERFNGVPLLGFWQNPGGSRCIVDERYNGNPPIGSPGGGVVTIDEHYNGVPPIGILPDSRQESMYHR